MDITNNFYGLINNRDFRKLCRLDSDYFIACKCNVPKFGSPLMVIAVERWIGRLEYGP